jgi:metal-sulfur cluster biosynthetic enzyme
MAQDAQADLKQSVLRALSSVTDPELDEPITDLGFVKDLSISKDGRVSLDLVTSTFWCSPNFVYMMLEEARDVVSKLPGITAARVRLEGHHDAGRINEGINSGKSFSECYSDEAHGDLEALNRMIRTRALRSRLYSMAAAMSRSGVMPRELLGLSRHDIAAEGDTLIVKLRGDPRRISEPSDVQRVVRYLSFRDGLGLQDAPLVIWDLDGRRPGPDEFSSMLTLGRSAKANFSLNAELCRALLSARMNRDADPTISYSTDR